MIFGIFVNLVHHANAYKLDEADFVDHVAAHFKLHTHFGDAERDVKIREAHADWNAFAMSHASSGMGIFFNVMVDAV